MKFWDIGGQFQYRQNWIDYAKMADVIIFMVDASNVMKIFHNFFSMKLFQFQRKNYTDY